MARAAANFRRVAAVRAANEPDGALADGVPGSAVVRMKITGVRVKIHHFPTAERNDVPIAFQIAAGAIKRHEPVLRKRDDVKIIPLFRQFDSQLAIINSKKSRLIMGGF